MAETEKITINMNVVDLGKVDLLVEQGFYSNRTDFIKTSIRNQLSTHANVVDTIITDKSYVLGVSHYTRESLEKVLAQNKILDIKVVGMLVFADDIDEELAIKTIKSLKVFGVFKATPEIKKVLNQ
ncbi:CopG family transcriptional regulator [Solibacillus sp. CAU 1738]|uniref:CopG family transcriptional regulator n=1 Tax=Solibacillus sp. CAU 1738 TaxID=3140363 RepID=UPI00326033ED